MAKFEFVNFSFKPEEFLVEEIGADGTLFELDKAFALGKGEDQALERDYFTHFVLQKREWNTAQALGALARFLHIKHLRFNFAGTKDRNALTTQLCSVFALPPDRLEQAKGRVKDVQINGSWKARGKVKLGDLQGNRFTITPTAENCAGLMPIASRVLVKAHSAKFLFPNFFGLQRFGSIRHNTAEVGRHILREEFEAAVMNYLAFSEGERDEESVAARKRLAEEKDFAKAGEYFPRHLKYERMLLEHLAQNPKDFVGALGKFPRSLLLMFIHAFQSKLFNLFLEERLRKDKLWLLEEKGKLIGSDSVLTEEEIALLDTEGIPQDSFKIKQMPFLSSKGSERPFFAELKEFQVLNENPLTLRFSLDAGCYATVALSWLLKE
ncbi:TPA: tRNA pseudouridine(13) synthase TruD [Candidatus Micrarchaeota archaeon]|nr:tRNA pseudouridine(13) synthase TruD [Candidatus Micrarchaeota archaeon]